MTARQLRALCLTLPGATATLRWGSNRVLKLGGDGVQADKTAG